MYTVCSKFAICSFFDAYRGCGSQPIDPDGQAAVIDSPIEDFLGDLVIFFGGYTAIQLSNTAHAEEPWMTARSGFGRRDKSDVVMPIGFLRSYYCRLLSDGEHALSQHELLNVVPEPRWSAYYVAGISSRRFLNHPLYRPALATKLSMPVPEPDALDADFYAPVGEPDFVEFKNNAA